MKNIMMMISLCTLIYGCSYTVPATLSPAANFFSSYEDKIQGGVVLVIDENLKRIDRNIKPLSSACSAHHYPLNMGSSLADSVKKTTDVIFKQVIEQNTLPTKEELKEMNCQGTVYVKLNIFYPTLRVCDGTALANCNIVLDVTIKDANQHDLLVTTVAGARFAEGDSKGSCKGGATVLSEAVSLSMREAMERYAERVSNFEKIRKAFVPKEH
jgi:hypothetical protein